MGSISKHQQDHDEDRISNLPPHLISHILSFVPTKMAVRTSVLSTYWYQQWTSITRLHLVDYPMNPSRFESFVHYFLRLLTVTRLEVFRLSWSQPYDVTHIYAMVSTALSQFSVRHTELILDCNVVLELHLLLPCCLRSCASLEVLNLGGGFFLKVPTSTSLVCLKILHLDFVSFSDDESFSRLISSCPVLEELNLQGGSGTNGRIFNISSPSLKRLVVFFPLIWYKGCNHAIVLNTPSLQYLAHDDNCIPISYSVVKIPCLERARVYIEPNKPLNHYDDSDYLVFKPISDLAVGISNVRFLSLSKGSLEALGRSLCKLPMFPRLINLKTEVLTKVGWRVLTAFLESSPQLATLIFGVVKFHLSHCGGAFGPLCWSESTDEIYATQASVPHCVLFNLKVIEVRDFIGLEQELEIVRYFLEQAKCLSRLMISPRNDLGFFMGLKEMAFDEVMKFPKSSRSCEVVVMGD